MSEILSDAEISTRADPHWRVVLGRLHTTVRTGSFVDGVRLVQRVAEVAEGLGHHPDVDVRYATVHISSVSHDVGRLTTKDVELAAAISAVLTELELEADPTAPQALEIAVDAMDIPAVVPFWQAVLGYGTEPPPAADASPALVDPAGIGPAVWFQQMDEPRPQRNRIHVDVSVGHDVAEQRVREALAAGGRLVTDRYAPSFWVLADVEGNEVCVCTWQGRE